jgi:hypothetical protein
MTENKVEYWGRNHGGIVLAVVGAAVLLNIWTMSCVPGADAAEWLIAARDLAFGKIPYRDYMIHVGPLAIWILGLFFKLLGPKALVASFTFMLFNLGTAWGVYQLSRQTAGPSQSAFAACAYGVTVPFFGGSQMYVEPFVAFFGVWAFVLLNCRAIKSNRLIPGAVLLLLSFLTKQTALLLLIAQEFNLLIGRYKRGGTNQENIPENFKPFNYSIVMAIVFLCGFAITCAYFFFSHCLDWFLYDFFIVPHYCGFELNWHGIYHVFGSVAPWLFLLAFVGGFTMSSKKSPSYPAILLAALLPLPAVFRAASYHYLIVALPFICFFAGHGLVGIIEKISSLPSKAIALSIALILCIPTSGRILMAVIRPLDIFPSALGRLVKYTPFNMGIMHRQSLFTEVSKAKRMMTFLPPNGEIYLNTNLSIYDFYMGRTPPGRHITHIPVLRNGKEDTPVPLGQVSAIITGEDSLLDRNQEKVSDQVKKNFQPFPFPEEPSIIIYLRKEAGAPPLPSNATAPPETPRSF